MSSKQKLPLSKSFLYITLSIITFSLGPFFVLNVLRQKNHKMRFSQEQPFKYLAQTGPVKGALKNQYLEELLDLSVDFPKNLNNYDFKKGEQSLLDTVIFKNVQLKIDSPNTLLIDYTLREPVALLADYENVALDEEGYIFPLIPFYTPKKLPEVYLGVTINPFTYGKINTVKWIVAQKILDFFEVRALVHFSIKKIDVSFLNADSLGKREVIVELLEGSTAKKRFLRLSADMIEEGLEHYLSLKAMSIAQDLVVDLRLLPDAYLTPLHEMEKV